MTDTLQNGEIMYVSKPEYLLGDPARGDVVICHYPGREENFVKRVIGLPGDVVEIRSNQVYVNGEPLDEPYLPPSRNDDGFSMAPFALGADEYFVMGDNRDNSHDSRNYYGAGPPRRDHPKGHRGQGALCDVGRWAMRGAWSERGARIHGPTGWDSPERRRGGARAGRGIFLWGEERLFCFQKRTDMV